MTTDKDPQMYQVEMRLLGGSDVSFECPDPLPYRQGKIYKKPNVITPAMGWVALCTEMGLDDEGGTPHGRALKQYEYHRYNTLRAVHDSGLRAELRVVPLIPGEVLVTTELDRGIKIHD